MKKFEGQPFALIGVNSDTNLEALKKIHEAGDVTWRSFLDGKGGPIAQAWGIQGWPTIFIIDHQGVIRHVTHEGDEIEGMIEKLMREIAK